MCCRYFMELSPELRPFVDAMNRSALADKMRSKLGKPLVTSGEARPTDIVPVVGPDKKGNAMVFPMLWGFTNPRSGQPIINCRVESAAEKPMWKDAWASHRCIIPASWYYEWEHTPQNKTGQKYLIQPTGSNVTYLAGLYRIETMHGIQVPVFTVLTRVPGESIRFIHDRMPVILPKEMVRQWVSPNSDPSRIVKASLTDMVFEKAM